MQSNCFKWRLISLFPQCLRLIANRESRIDINRNQPRRREKERNVEKKLYIIIKANGPQTCPSNDEDDDDEDDAAVSIPVPVPVPVDADDDDEP